jgi:hypothetical protein
LKKLQKIIILVVIFVMPNIASAKECGCYNTFNAGWQAANTSFATCAMNALAAVAGAYGGAASGNGVGGAITAAGGISALGRCEDTFYTIWDQLGAQFDFCITGC